MGCLFLFSWVDFRLSCLQGLDVIIMSIFYIVIGDKFIAKESDKRKKKKLKKVEDKMLGWGKFLSLI